MSSATTLERDAAAKAEVDLRQKIFSPANMMLAAAFCGVVLGVIVNLSTSLSQRTHAGFIDTHRMIKLPGDLWLRGLSLAVLPFIASNMTMSLADLRSVEGAGPRLVKRTVGYYLLTTLIACFLGLFLSVVMLMPNVKTLAPDPDAPTPDAAEKNVVDQVYAIFHGIVPKNIVAAASTNNLLGVITFFGILGFLIDNTKGDSPIYAIMAEINKCMNTVIMTLVSFAPIGVFCLLYPTLATVADMGNLWKSAGILIGTCYVGVACMTFGVYPIIFACFHRGGNVIGYYDEIKEAVFTALGTSSSAATLPVTTRCVINAGVSADLAKFVCSLGATVNMDGSAVTYPSFVLFMAASQGVDITVAKAITIAFVSTLASVGAAPIPNAGAVLLIMILETVGIPVSSLLSVCILVDAIFVDRFQTMNNIIGDGVAAKCLDTWNRTDTAVATAASERQPGSAVFVRGTDAGANNVTANPLAEGIEEGVDAENGRDVGTISISSNAVDQY